MKDDCPFCDYDGVIVGKYTWAEGPMPTVFIINPLNPVTPGHLLVLPEQHVADALEDPILTGYVFRTAALIAKMRGEPCNLITSAGTSATQTVHHLHVHIVPRRPNDGLALPWTGQK